MANSTDVFFCGLCKKEILIEVEKNLMCNVCDLYFHSKKCLKLTEYFHKKFLKIGWTCTKCRKNPEKNQFVHRRSISVSSPTKTNESVTDIGGGIDHSIDTGINTNEVNTDAPQRLPSLSFVSSADLSFDVITTTADVHRNASVREEHNQSEMSEKPQWVNELQSSIKEILNKQNDFSKMFSDFESTILNLQKEMKNLREQNKALNKENDELRTRVDNSHYRLNSLEQKSLVNDALICGVPEKASEDLFQVITSIDKASGGPLVDKSDILAVFRIRHKKKKSDGFPRPIVVKFSKNNKKNDFIKRCKKMRKNLTTKIFDSHSAQRPVYVSESLTNTTAFLMAKMKELNRGRFKYIWVKNGNILIRRVDNDPIIRISNLNHVKELTK